MHLTLLLTSPISNEKTCLFIFELQTISKFMVQSCADSMVTFLVIICLSLTRKPKYQNCYRQDTGIVHIDGSRLYIYRLCIYFGDFIQYVQYGVMRKLVLSVFVE